MDVADFLQRVSAEEGDIFTEESESASLKENESEPRFLPRSSEELASAWEKSSLFNTMKSAMESDKLEYPGLQFREEYTSKAVYPATYAFYFRLLWERQIKLTTRDLSFVMTRLARYAILGAICASLFNNIEAEDAASMEGFLFFFSLTFGVGNITLIPTLFAQRRVFDKQTAALFYPKAVFGIVQTLSLIPVQILETLLFCSITYWSVGMASETRGSKFLLFCLVNILFNLNYSQLIRLISSLLSSPALALPLNGVVLMLLVLFCGYILPKSLIPSSLIFMYWLNPIAWTIQALLVNEYTASDYDFTTCISSNCTHSIRFGDQVLHERGNPTEVIWVYYALILLFLEFLIFVLLTNIAMDNVSLKRFYSGRPAALQENTPAVTRSESNSNCLWESTSNPITFSFKDIWYTVKVKGGEEMDLLRGVSGYAAPGTLTALMGSSGAGKIFWIKTQFHHIDCYR
jgi:ABC-type multidrug transport system permease subunit